MDNQNVLNQTPVTTPVTAMAETAVLPIEVAVVGTEEKPEEKSNNAGGGSGGSGEGEVCGGDSDLTGKRKRGRPRKNPIKPEDESLPGLEYSSSEKRGRGRPKGSGKWQKLAASSLEGTQPGIGSAGSSFTPHIIKLVPGENMTQIIWSFSQRTSDSICILSASGVLSSAEILEPGLKSVLRYQGWYDIVSLNGSHTYTAERGGQCGKNCQLSVQLLSSPEGRLFGGVVAGPLIVAQPTMLVLATFKEGSKVVPKNKHRLDPANKTNKVIAAVPLETGNGKFPEEPEEETNSLALAPVVPPSVQSDEVINDISMNNNNQGLISDVIPENINGTIDVIQDSADVMKNGPHDVITDSSHQEAQTVDDEEFMNSVIPSSSPQHADWNSSSAVFESGHAADNPSADIDMTFNDQ